MSVRLIFLFLPFLGFSQWGDFYLASLQQANSDPILAIGNVEASWREEAWSATGTAGTWTDNSGNGNNLTVVGGAPQVQSASVYQVYYDGTDDHHALSTDVANLDFLPGTDSFTIAVKLGNTAPTAGVVNSGGHLVNKGTFNGITEYQYGISYWNTNQFYVTCGGDNTIFSYNPIAEDEIVVVFTASDVSLYVNGSQIGTTTAFTGTFQTTQPVSIASRNGGGNQDSEVYIRDIIIFSKALDASERTTVFDNL